MKVKVLTKEVAKNLKRARELPDFRKQAVLTDENVQQLLNDYHEMEYIYQKKKYELMEHFGRSFDEWCFKYDCFPTTFDDTTPREYVVIDHSLVDDEKDSEVLTKEDKEFLNKWLEDRIKSVDDND